MRPSDEIENVVKKMSFKASPEMDKDLWAETLKAQNEFRKTILAPGQHNIWRTIMKSPITKFATAAIVVIACLIGLSLWRGTESGIALADVMARIEKVKAVRYKWTYTIELHDPNKPFNHEIRATSLNSGEYGNKSKLESLDPNSGQSTFTEIYFLPQKRNTIITIFHREKTYWRTEDDDVHFKQVQSDDPSAKLKEILKYKYESLGRSTIDGIQVAGFRTTDPNHWGGQNPQVDIKLWVDVKTLLPVRYDCLVSEEVNKRGDKMNSHYMMHDFQWDIPVDAAEFEPVIPDNYKVVLKKFPAHITEESAIQGLKVWVELLGKYPQINWDVPLDYGWLRSVFEKSETPTALRLKEETKGLTNEEMGNKLVDFLMPIRGLGRFYSTLQKDKKNRAYYGEAVTPKDADKVLIRWKVSDNEYRVIYGDLHAETVTPAKLAELEAALPK